MNWCPSAHYLSSSCAQNHSEDWNILTARPNCVPQYVQIWAGTQDPPVPPPQDLLEKVCTSRSTGAPTSRVLYIYGTVQNSQRLPPGFFTSASDLRDLVQFTGSSFSAEWTSQQGYSRNPYWLWQKSRLLPTKGTSAKHGCGCFADGFWHECTHRRKTRSPSIPGWASSFSSSLAIFWSGYANLRHTGCPCLPYSVVMVIHSLASWQVSLRILCWPRLSTFLDINPLVLSANVLYI